jgi:hypothetical protein
MVLMKLNATLRVPAGYTPPPIPAGLCGPEALAQLLIEGRKVQTDWNGPISDDGIRTLVNLIFFASLMAEEGRYPRYKLVCEPAEGSFFLVAKIDPLPLDGVNQIRRRAPACAHPDCAILVAERGGSLWCDGVMNVGGMGYDSVPGHPGVIGVGRAPGLHLEVFGPGHLRGSETIFGAYEIRAGRIRSLSAYDRPEPVRTLLNSLQARVTRGVLPRLGDDGQKYEMRVKDWRPLLQVLSRLLRTAAHARHGGAFVFLPDARREPTEYGLNILYRTTSLDLGGDLVEQWVTCLQSHQQCGSPERENTLRRSEVLRVKLLTNTEAVGHFSCVDGCVVLTREFNVLGFGAKIDAPVNQAQASPRRFKHIASGEVYDDKTFMAAIGGTRHQSAARLCQIHPGVMVLTLSQDGDLKLFTSDEQFAYAYGPLDLPTIENEISL